jgi:hypothetical protein
LGCVDDQQPTDKKQGMDQDKKRVSLSMGRRGACPKVVATLLALGRQGSVNDNNNNHNNNDNSNKQAFQLTTS